MRVLYEENRGVIPDEVENALFGIEFGGEAADITHRVGRTRAALYGRETHKTGVILFDRKGNLLW